MVAARFAALAVVVLATANNAVDAQACSTPQYGSCGSNAGVTCCPTGQYCQPWNSDYFQCIAPPAKCSQQFTNIDFYGNDIKTVYVNLPSLCCDECAKTAGCTSYTFINSAPGSPACYLKSGSASDRRTVIGAVSGLVNGGSTSAPTPAPPTVSPTPTPEPRVCTTEPFAMCDPDAGNDGRCCRMGQYCKPLVPTVFRCDIVPSKCLKQLPNMDLYGNDIKSVSVGYAGECCDECANTPGCKAYTYDTSVVGPPVCYLKSAAGTPTRLVGAVSGVLN